MASNTVKIKTKVKKKPAVRKKPESRKKTSEKGASVVCFNRDCKLRIKKRCKGFEGCPGFKGR